MSNGYGETFDGTDSLSFGDELTQNVVNFGVYNSSLRHSENCNNNLFILGEGPTDDIDSSAKPEKSSILILLNEK